MARNSIAFDPFEQSATNCLGEGISGGLPGCGTHDRWMARLGEINGDRV
jgi:hypothetical protein